MVISVKISLKHRPFLGSLDLAKNTSQSIVIDIASVGMKIENKETAPQTITTFRQHALVKLSSTEREAQKEKYMPSLFKIAV